MNEEHRPHVDPDVDKARGYLRATLGTQIVRRVQRVLNVELTEEQMSEIAGPANNGLVIALDLLDRLAQIEAFHAVRSRFVEPTDHREVVLVRGGRINCMKHDAHVHVPHTTIEHAQAPGPEPGTSNIVLSMRETPVDEEATPPASDKLN